MSLARSPDRSPDEDLAELLARRLGKPLQVGELSGTLHTGAFVVEVHIRIRSRIDGDASRAYLDAALEHLGKRSRWPDCSGHGGRRGYCSHGPSHVVVSRNWRIKPTDPELHFDFLCGVHAKRYQVAPGVSAVIPIPKRQLEELRAELKRREECGYTMRARWEKIASGIAYWMHAIRGEAKPWPRGAYGPMDVEDARRAAVDADRREARAKGAAL